MMFIDLLRVLLVPLPLYMTYNLVVDPALFTLLWRWSNLTYRPLPPIRVVRREPRSLTANNSSHVVSGRTLEAQYIYTSQSYNIFHFGQDHVPMAPITRGKKNLVCFYCNRTSSIKFDGFITCWDCAQCGSPNFLDEVLFLDLF